MGSEVGKGLSTALVPVLARQALGWEGLLGGFPQTRSPTGWGRHSTARTHRGCFPGQTWLFLGSTSEGGGSGGGCEERSLLQALSSLCMCVSGFVARPPHPWRNEFVSLFFISCYYFLITNLVSTLELETATSVASLCVGCLGHQPAPSKAASSREGAGPRGELSPCNSPTGGL